LIRPSTRVWSLVALLAALAFVAAVIFPVLAAPRGVVGYRTAFDTLRLLAYAGIAGAAICLVLATVWHGTRSERILFAAAMLLFALPAATLVVNRASAPPGEPINDITTDPDDPPVFSAVIPYREPGSNPIEYGGPRVAARQREVYPQVRPIETPLGKDAAFQRAFETAEALGWNIVAADLYRGIIEAIDTTTFFRFKDDIVIRVREEPSGSRVDLRSRSRVGRSDLGKNAARIMEFAESFERTN
jgi:uncharacterized protein (DUF1499 family)